MTYNELLDEMDSKNCRIYEMNFKSAAKGLCIDNNVFISKKLDGDTERKCILAEELGHIMTTQGNILDNTKAENRKQELQARAYAYDLLIGLDGILLAYMKHCRSIDEFADFLDVTKPFFEDALVYYARKYGDFVEYKTYTIRFSPCLYVFTAEEWNNLKNEGNI